MRSWVMGAVSACVLLAPVVAGERLAAADKITAFWSWWAEARPRYEVSGVASADLQRELDARVAAIHRDLAWEIGGAPGQHRLTVSPEGKFELRKLTARWVRLAPRTPGWTYEPARARDPELDFSVKTQGLEVALRAMRFFVEPDEARARVNVRAYHAAFAGAADAVAQRITLLALDTLLGEDDVERFVGGLEIAKTEPPGAVDAVALRAAVDKMNRGGREPAFSMIGDPRARRPVLAMIDLGLKRLDHLEHDWHLEVTIPFRAPSANGFPTPDEHQATAALEDALVDALGKDVVYYGHAIRDGKLAIFFYAARRETVEAVLGPWLAARAGRKIKRVWTSDPTWARHARY
jgi:hypothetical protein